jgi:hypothetical protein
MSSKRLLEMVKTCKICGTSILSKIKCISDLQTSIHATLDRTELINLYSRPQTIPTPKRGTQHPPMSHTHRPTTSTSIHDVLTEQHSYHFKILKPENNATVFTSRNTILERPSWRDDEIRLIPTESY